MEENTHLFIDQLRRREPGACRQLIADHGPAVFRMVQRIVGRQEDAEEVWQDVFVKALQAIAAYDSRKASLATWLSRIAYNESVNFVRRRRPDIVYMDDCDLAPDSPDETPDDHVVDDLEQALAKLPPHEQAIVTMFYYDDMSLADIGYVTGSTASTVGSQLCRIRKKLYRIIKTMHP